MIYIIALCISLSGAGKTETCDLNPSVVYDSIGLCQEDADRANAILAAGNAVRVREVCYEEEARL